MDTVTSFSFTPGSSTRQHEVVLRLGISTDGCQLAAPVLEAPGIGRPANAVE